MKQIICWAASAAALSAGALDFTGLGFAGRNGELGVETLGRGDETIVRGLKFRDGGGRVSLFWGGMDPCNKWCAAGNVRDQKVSVDKAAEKVVVTGVYQQGEKNPDLPFYQSLSRSADGRRVRLEIRLGDEKTPAKGFRLDLGGSLNGRLFGEDRERRIAVGGEEVDLSFVEEKERTCKRFGYWHGDGSKELVLDMAADRSILAFRLLEGQCMGLSQNWEKPQERYDRTDYGFTFTADARIVLEIDFDRTPSESKLGYIVRGVNFAPAGFRMPDFSRSRNLLLNGSFEEGFYLWQTRPCGHVADDPRPDEFAYQVDETTAVDGRRSFRMRVHPGSLLQLCTFGIPVTPRKTYTLSFWAKTDLDGNPGLFWTGWTQAYGPYVDAGQMGALTKEWKRYTKTYVAPNKFLSCSLVPTDVKGVGHIWVDRVQLVEGEVADDIPVGDPGFVLETAHAMNWCQPGERLGARVRFQSAHGGEAKVAWNVKDVFRRVVRTGAFALTVPAAHEPTFRDVGELEGLDSGTYSVEMTVEGFGAPVTRHFRFTLMPKLPHAFKNRFLLNGMYGGVCDEMTSRVLPFWADAGIGSVIAFRPPNREMWERYLKPLDIVPCSCVFNPHIDKNYNQESFYGKYNLARTRPDGLQTVPDSARELFVKQAAEMQRKFPYVKWWKTVNEPMYSDEDVRNAVRVLKWTAEGIRSVNPQAIVLTPDPGALDENVRKLWDAGCKDYCDYPAVHPYREHPEDPDLDANIQMLREWFPGHKVLFTEGNFFTCLELPENSCTAIGQGKALGSGDANRIGQMTPDIGLGELAGTAHAMRYRLQVLKNADFVLMDNDWGCNDANESFMGIDLIPTARIFAVNTIGRLLGDATFVSDVLFGEPIRCYLFEDAAKRPVAVIWNYHKEIFVKPRLVSSLDWKGMTEKAELFNLVGAREKVAADGFVPVTGAPLFIRGETGRMAAFKKALEALDMVGGEVPDFRVDKSVEDGAMKVTLVNIRARENRGHLRLLMDGRTVKEEDVVLAPQAKHAVSLPLAGQYERKRHELAFEFTAEGKAKVLKEFSLDCFCIREMPRASRADGDLAKWADAPVIRLPTYRDLMPPTKSKWFANPLFRKGDADLSATMKAKWAPDGLYLLVEVTDDVYSPDQDEQIGRSYRGDGLQLYIDTFGDGVNAIRDQYDPDDQVYMIRCRDGKKVECWREREPWKQYAFTKKGPEPRIGGTFAKTASGWRMDLKLPLEALPPIVLEKGRAVGISVMVNDHDDDYRKRECYLSEGPEPMNRPRTWPLMILE